MNLLPNTEYRNIEMTIITACMTNVAGISVDKPQRVITYFTTNFMSLPLFFIAIDRVYVLLLMRKISLAKNLYE